MPHSAFSWCLIVPPRGASSWCLLVVPPVVPPLVASGSTVGRDPGGASVVPPMGGAATGPCAASLRGCLRDHEAPLHLTLAGRQHPKPQTRSAPPACNKATRQDNPTRQPDETIRQDNPTRQSDKTIRQDNPTRQWRKT